MASISARNRRLCNRAVQFIRTCQVRYLHAERLGLPCEQDETGRGRPRSATLSLWRPKARECANTISDPPMHIVKEGAFNSTLCRYIDLNANRVYVDSNRELGSAGIFFNRHNKFVGS